jgi:rubrerythrin
MIAPNQNYSLTELLRQGYWFCFHCSKIVILGEEKESPAQCPKCHRRTATWQHPVNLEHQN